MVKIDMENAVALVAVVAIGAGLAAITVNCEPL